MNRFEIYSRIESVVNTESRPVYCASRPEPIPPMFPCCFIEEAEHSPDYDAIQLDHKEKQIRTTWEINVFTNKMNTALEDAYEIMADIEDEMKRMYFTETSCMQMDNADPSVYRLVARFERVIGSEEPLPERE